MPITHEKQLAHITTSDTLKKKKQKFSVWVFPKRHEQNKKVKFILIKQQTRHHKMRGLRRL